VLLVVVLVFAVLVITVVIFVLTVVAEQVAQRVAQIVDTPVEERPDRVVDLAHVVGGLLGKLVAGADAVRVVRALGTLRGLVRTLLSILSILVICAFIFVPRSSLFPGVLGAASALWPGVSSGALSSAPSAFSFASSRGGATPLARTADTLSHARIPGVEWHAESAERAVGNPLGRRRRTESNCERDGPGHRR